MAADPPNTFGLAAPPNIAQLHHQMTDGLLLAPSICVAGLQGVYPTKDFNKGDILCTVECTTGQWTELEGTTETDSNNRFGVRLQLPNPKNITRGKLWDLVMPGDPHRFVWPHFNSTAIYQHIHGQPANARLQLVGTELKNNSVHIEMLTDCPAFSGEILLDYAIEDLRQTVQMPTTPQNSDLEGTSPVKSTGSLWADPGSQPTSTPPEPVGPPQHLGPALITPTFPLLQGMHGALDKTEIHEYDKGLKVGEPQTAADIIAGGECLVVYDKPAGSSLYWLPRTGKAYLTFTKAATSFPGSVLYSVLGGDVARAPANALLPYVLTPKTLVWCLGLVRFHLIGLL